jgi:recombination protein RecR
MALHLLEKDRQGARVLALNLAEAMEKIGNCRECRTFSEAGVCGLCANPVRDGSLVCVVETPMDVLAIEQSASFSGKYFVLMGHLSPLDGIGAADIGLDVLEARLGLGEINELILATNPTVEGEATAEYIRDMATRFNILVTRIAQGVPVGGELGFVDQGTISHALLDRKPFAE